MKNREKKMLILEGIQLERAGGRGKAVGHEPGGRVVLASGVVPGDVADLRVIKKKRGFYEAKLHNLITPSPDREKPVCDFFGQCGGCKWQNLKYEKQLEYKQDEVYQNLKRIGKLEPEELLPILPSSETYFYRNKMEFSFSDSRWITQEELDCGVEITNRNGLGFHVPGMWDKVIDIDKCHLQPSPSNEIRNFVRDYAEKHNLPYFNLREQYGLLRTLLIRTALSGEVMVLIQFAENNETDINGLLSALKNKFPQISSLLYTINRKGNDSIYDQEIILFDGKDHIIEEMPAYYHPEKKLNFKIGPKSFYQTNPKQAYELYKTALEFADISPTDLVYDLYTGTGTIAIFMAQVAKKVVGIESVPEAIEDAYENMKLNVISNLEFVAGDMKVELNDEFISEHGNPDVIVVDPPRDGMHKKVVEKILEIAPPKIVYVSCNSATQARDLELMKDRYLVTKSMAVDMFPQTHHIENVVQLIRK